MSQKSFRSVEEWKKEYYPSLFAAEKGKRNKLLNKMGNSLAEETMREVRLVLSKQK